jgi:S1-C subfamily serine protease
MNDRVVEDAGRISVRFAGDTLVEAELIGADVDSNPAVIQVEVTLNLIREGKDLSVGVTLEERPGR